MLLDAALSIIDRLIALAKGRIEGRKEVLATVLEPVFNDMVQVHMDYMKIISKAGHLIDGTHEILEAMADPARRQTKHHEPSIWNRVRQTREYLTQARTELEPVRIKSRAFLISFAERDLPSEETAFVRSVAIYLGMSNFPNCNLKLPMHRTPATSLIEVLSEMQQSKTLREDDAIDAVQLLSSRLKDEWSDLCLRFAELKITVAEKR